ncbi:MAG TPA: DEAD/DEAH box helicase [Longimicrobiales bacterium]|nr:DEAD/DEAH box helicase [Longimicrobiales bacterium]
MQHFTEITSRWFEGAFERPTDVQRIGWDRIAAGDHTLLIAPTGSGKTLAAFLYAIDRLTRLPDDAEPGVRVVYVSPLKALAYDIDRNLRVPLAGIRRAAGLEDPAAPPVGTAPSGRAATVNSAATFGSAVSAESAAPSGSAASPGGAASAESAAPSIRLPRVDVRTGDTPPQDRRRQAKDPAEILVTTPESLYLILGSQARETLRTVRWIIIDEVHAVAATKRGSHLSLSLERLSAIADEDPQRIGLSATARPASEVARFLGGDRPVSIVDTHRPPALDLQVVVTVDDMTRPVIETEDGGFEVLSPDQPGSGSLMLADHDQATRQYGIWPAIYPRLIELIRAHRSTIVFVNSRGLCERLAQRLNETAGEDLVRAHHGSVAQSQRRDIEEALKAGTLPAIVATSSLELGIDMGAVDLVILVESPGAVSRGLQRIGRAGHGVGETSIGRIFPKHRGDLLEAAIVTRRMREGAIEALRIPRNPLDVLAQHIVAMTGIDDWHVPDLARVVRRSASFHALPDDALRGVLDMLAGLYPSHDFADLRPRLTWDREHDLLQGRRSARMLAAVNAGTIPDRGMYGVFLGDDGPRIGELDEEMVHEVTAGQTFTLGASTWRIQRINRNRVVVEPAPGEPGRLPFWKGEGPGRPLELGRALGAMTRTLASMTRAQANAVLRDEYALDERAANNLVEYLDDQRDVAGTLPTDRDITVERFRDELGDWRVCILTPFGARVHAPWALALRAIVSERVGYDVQAIWSDDGIVITIADGDEPPDASLLVPDSDDLEDRLLLELPRSPIFAAEFRENAARALLLPRRRPGQRTPLFAQRLRAQKLMEIALEYPSFPIVVETFRSCMQDVFDVPALREVLRAVESGEVRIHDVETASASPFARSLVFAYVAAYMYEDDSPAAERRAQALSVDVKLLRELLGEADLRELLDADIIAEVEAALQRKVEGRRARHADDLHDMLRQLGDLSEDEIAVRIESADLAPMLRELTTSRRAVRVRVAGRDAWIAIEDAALYRDALGTSPPQGIASVFLEPVDQPVDALLMRWARTHGPFTTDAVAARYALVPAQADVLLQRLAAEGKLLHGEFTPGASGGEWCEPDVLRQIKRRTIAMLRGQVAPVPREVLGRFLPSWHRTVASDPYERIEEAITQLEGIPLSYRDLVRMILPARMRNFRPEQLDELGAMGWLVWTGHSPLRGDDGRIVLYRRDRVDRLLIPADEDEAIARIDDFDERHRTILDRLAQRGASFHAELVAALPAHDADAVLDAVWDLVWAGLITNDTFAALSSLGVRRRRTSRRAQRPRPLGIPGERSESAQRRRLPRGWWRGTGAGGGGGPVVGGRWSLVRDLVHDTITSTERAHAWAATLLDRHGIVARETAQVEALGGGFGSVYNVLRSMEDAGKLRRGYFVEGLGGSQFAWPGIVDRLRRERDAAPEGTAVALAATDPANPYGWLLPWPALTADEGTSGARRAAGVTVVLVDGIPVLYLNRDGRRLRTFADATEQNITRALPALRTVARARSARMLNIEQIDGTSALDSPLRPLLRAAGFESDYRFMRLRV